MTTTPFNLGAPVPPKARFGQRREPPTWNCTRCGVKYKPLLPRGADLLCPECWAGLPSVTQLLPAPGGTGRGSEGSPGVAESGSLQAVLAELDGRDETQGGGPAQKEIFDVDDSDYEGTDGQS